jgi:hypothetical protein
VDGDKLMTPLDIDRIRQVDDFESLIVFLRDELDWPLETEDIEELSFDYEPEELGLSEEVAVKINSIKQLRPLAENQPWGIFYIDFEPKKLPVVVLRRVLQKLIVKKRPTSQRSNMPGWQMNDLLFINSFGQQDERAITFAHFRREDENQLPTLKVIGWDGQDTPLHLDRCQNELGYLRFDPEIDPEQWRQNWSQAFTTIHRHTINTSKNLAKELAQLAKIVRISAEHILRYETESGRFKKAMAKFKTALIHDLTQEDFADMYAQTIAYGLLYTAIRSHVSGESTVVSAERVQQLVLPTNPFLKEVMEEFFNIGARKWDSEKEMITGIEFDELGINEIITTLKAERTDFDQILRDFNNRNPDEDPVIHFYELFLKEYDKQKRKSRGVYYTPRPVVSFIIRSVDEVLKRDFNLPLGLADTATWGEVHKNNPDIKIPHGVSEDDFFVQILDPALGTGTFLVEVIDVIYKTMVETWQKQGKDQNQIKKLWNRYVPDCLLPRLYGFELMMAPYAIAHMKIGIKLFETGYENFEQDKKRVQVYLTNTLEEAVDTSGYLDTLDPALAIETEQANILKSKNSITVVIGNPPYAGHSFNASKIKRHIEPRQSYQAFSRKHNKYVMKIAGTKGATEEKITWIGNLIKPYFFIDGEPLGEKNPKWLNDDYVKFIRYAQCRLDTAGTGVFGFITNHGYIDNPTFRGMRQSLMTTYSQINIVDLHGSSKKKEKCPDGSKDENVFEIQQGVAINIAAKSPIKNPSYRHTHLWGTRDSKFLKCQNNVAFSLGDITELNPVSDMYLFCPQDSDLQSEYDVYVKITDIMLINSVGIVTARDNLTIQNSHNDVWNTINDFISLETEAARDKYQLGHDVRDWKVSFAQEDVRSNGPQKEKIVKVLYRPFDSKYTYYTGRSRGFICMPRPEVMHHMLTGENLGLISARSNKSSDMDHFFCTRFIMETKCGERTTQSCILPLYLYPEEGHMPDRNWPVGKDGRTPNIAPEFENKFSEAIGLQFVSDGKGDLNQSYGPEDLFNYLYSVFHSLTYRTRYADFLKRDFPRVPITANIDLFQQLCFLGSELVALHLMKSDKLNDHLTTFPVSGDNAVTKVGEKKKTLAGVENGKGKLYINKTQYFDNLSEEVWNFHIGGYQVCYKWLADRKKAGRKLSADDIDHYHKIVVAIDETIKIMNQIDETIATHTGWPIK